MKIFLQKVLVLCSFGLTLLAFQSQAQSVLINYDFRNGSLPSEITLGGTANQSTGGTIGSCTACSQGRVNVPLNSYIQVDITSCTVFNLRMKSSGASARTVTILYKKSGDADYTSAGTVSVPQAGVLAELTTSFPSLITSGSISVRIANGASGGEFHIHDIYVEGGGTVLSDEAEITAFKIDNQISNEVITSNDGTIVISVPSGTDLTSIVPSTLTLSANATINPAEDVAQDFSNENEVAYTVTAEDGTTTKEWTVKVTEVASSEKEVTAFRLSNSQIGNAQLNSGAGTIIVSMPIAEDLTNLAPVELTISDHATIDPAIETTRDFSSPVDYTVTAQDNSAKVWTVTVNQIDPNAVFTDYQAEDAIFTGNVETQHANYTGTGFINFLTAGENYIQFTVCQQVAGTQTAKFRYSLANDEIRTANLYVNDVFVDEVEFPRTITFADWLEVSVPVSLQAGINTVKLTWEETDGPNLDKLSLTGAQCPSYTLNLSVTNSGIVSVSPARSNNTYFDGETITLLAENKPDRVFANWAGDLTGTTNPEQVVMNTNKTIAANFTVVTTYSLSVNVTGVGEVTLNPAGGEYAEGTEVTLTATPVLGSTFQQWGGDASGTTSPTTITMTSNKSVTATFASNLNIDFEVPVGFASVNTGSTYPDFNGPTTGGQNAQDTLWVNGAADFDMLAWHLYYRNRAYKNQSGTNGVPKAPLVIVFKEGVYPEGTSSSSAWGNSMLTIQEQGDLTIIGQGEVVIKFGFNIKRSWNILIRNLNFQDYYDDGINIGEPETHHIWIDHCTIGHPTTLPANTEHPDGGIDVKNGASYVTISWCNYRNSWKTGLVGHSDSNGGEDRGKLKVTYYGNYFYNTNSRNPRVRFGEVHILNNLEENVMLYGIAAANEANVLAENNFFLNTRWAMYADRTTTDFKAVFGNNTDNVFTSKTGNYPAVGLKQVGNEYDDSGLPLITAQLNPTMLNPSGRSVKFDEFNPELVFNPSIYYSYTAFPASVVRTIVPLFAGAGKIDFFNYTPGEAPAASLNVVAELSSFTQTLGTPSSVQTYTVSAVNISSDLIVTPPANVEVSLNGNDWFTNASPLQIPATSGLIGTTTIQVRLNANMLGNTTGTIVHSATGTENVSVDIAGVTQEEPTGPEEGTWTIYEANQLPNAFSPVFVAASGSFSAEENVIVADSEREGNNLLRMSTTQAQYLWRMNFASHSIVVNNLTIVMRIKGNIEKDMAMDLDMHYNDKRSRISLHTNGDSAKIRNGSGENVKLNINVTTWNTYRFVMSATETKLFINESTEPSLVFIPAAAVSGNRHFRFGDGDSGASFGTDIDWIIWDVTGAYSPSETSIPASLKEEEDDSPDITATATLTTFIQTIGAPSETQTYSVSGNSLQGAIIITPPQEYNISLDGATWTGIGETLILTPANESVPASLIYVRLNAGTTGSFNGVISHTSVGAVDINVNVNGTTSEEEVPDPIMELTGTITPFEQIINTPSVTKSYTVSGSNLIAAITITPPTNFEVSTDGDTWKTNTNPLVLTPDGGLVVNTAVQVRLNAGTAGSYNGSIVHTTTGTSDVALPVSGVASVITSVPELLHDYTFEVMPNPMQDKLLVRRKELDGEAQLTLHSINGLIISTIGIEVGQAEVSLDVSSLAMGIYILEYKTIKGRQILRVAK